MKTLLPLLIAALVFGGCVRKTDEGFEISPGASSARVSEFEADFLEGMDVLHKADEAIREDLADVAASAAGVAPELAAKIEAAKSDLEAKNEAQMSAFVENQSKRETEDNSTTEIVLGALGLAGVGTGAEGIRRALKAHKKAEAAEKAPA